MDFKIPNLTTSNFKPLTKDHGFSLHQLSKWNQHLDHERLKNLYQQEDLIQQQKLAKLNSLHLNKQVHFIQQQAVALASELQQQKTKNQHLLLLVQNAEQIIYQHKLDKHQDLLNKKEPDQFEESKNILQENQKKLEKIVEKLNSSGFEISKKIDLIRALRSERAIHSNVFDKLEKEHFDVEFYYQQLLIERTLLEKQLEKSATHFNQVYQKSNLEKSRISQANRHSEAKETTQNGDTKNSKILNTTFRMTELTFEKELHMTERFKSKKDLILIGSIIMDQKNIDESKKLDFKKKLKSVLNDLSCQTFNDVLKNSILRKVSQEDTAFGQSNQICDQIFAIQKNIKSLENQLHKRKNPHFNHFSNNKLNIHAQISEFEAETQQTKSQITNFKSEFESFLKNIISDSEPPKNSGFTHLKYLSKTESSQKLTFSQNHELLKEIMAFFNDQLFDSYLQGNRNSNHTKARFMGEKGFARKKHHKLSSIGLQKKVRIMKTQTENTNQSAYSPRNSECLETILTMQNQANEKFEKGEKTDNLTIMTEEELIEESKRLIRQINKKKSEFVSNASLNKREKSTG